MRFSFESWSVFSDLGDPELVKKAFEAGQAALPQVGKGSKADEVVARFLIVDVRPNRAKAGSSSHDRDNMIAQLRTKLMEFILGKLSESELPSNADRLLFVGSARSLSSFEDEDHKIGLRSVKRDFEFAIRTLQSYGLAHYAQVDDDVERAATHPRENGRFIRSALIAFSRHYSEPRQNAAALQGILAEHVTRLFGSLKKIPEFEFVGKPDRLPLLDDLSLITEIGLLYQYGKGERPEPYDPTTQLEKMRQDGALTFSLLLTHSSYELNFKLLHELQRFAVEFHRRNSKDQFRVPESCRSSADQSTLASFKLARYDLLRDFGRVLGSGALLRLPQYREAILIIDDQLFSALNSEVYDPANVLVKRLEVAIGTAWPDGQVVHVAPSTVLGDHPGPFDASPLSLASSNAVRELVSRSKCELLPLNDYLAIFLDPESQSESRGPGNVQQLANHFAELAKGARADSKPGTIGPAIIAFSLRESSGYVQQCLNMGAAAFVAKHRPYQLLFDLARTLDARENRRLDTEQASQFRIMQALKPHVVAKLQSFAAPHAIHGGLQLSDSEFLEDPREHAWVRSLPKADLHCHIGTAIDPKIILILALNTSGHLITDKTRNWIARFARQDAVANHDVPSGLAPGPAELIARIARTVVLTGELAARMTSGVRVTPIELLAAACVAVVGPGLKNEPFGLGDKIVAHLLKHQDHCDLPHAAALLVAMIHAAEPGAEMPQPPGYFADLARLQPEDPVREDPSPGFDRHKALLLELERVETQFARLACRWDGQYSKDAFDALASVERLEFWRELDQQFKSRVDNAWKALADAAKTERRDWLPTCNLDHLMAVAARWLGLKETAFNDARSSQCWLGLADYVTTVLDDPRRGLQFYLRGADFLGSAHLQYPENLLLAARAITLDNARDNVVYTELRCETTGYTKAGMGAQDATEILRHGFNIASLYFAGITRSDSEDIKSGADSSGYGRFPLVRTNLLLAAKRHKGPEEARKVIALLEAYLERRPGVADDAYGRRIYRSRLQAQLPRWWRPCDVVGFDISGDESNEAKWLKDSMAPLAARSSPVTIHAGEAKDASSIWDAVHSLSALRIGHGLRLGEDIALLGYCVREGICMELCPNSNYYTNGYRARPHAMPRDEEVPERYDYPLLHYMRKGMEVTIGTDNRYLHPRGETELTDEYIRAARLVGGLTRWEVLQIVKAGFKNAFLDKSEVRELLVAVEESLYRLIDGHVAQRNT